MKKQGESMFPEKYKELFEEFEIKNKNLFLLILISSFILSMLLVIIPFRLFFGPLEMASPVFFLISFISTASGFFLFPYLMAFTIKKISK